MYLKNITGDAALSRICHSVRLGISFFLTITAVGTATAREPLLSPSEEAQAHPRIAGDHLGKQTLMRESQMVQVWDTVGERATWRNVYQKMKWTPAWGVDFYSFIDNTEFAGCKYQNDQTMTGVRVMPQVGVALNARQKHRTAAYRLMVGASATERFGEDGEIYDVDPLAYFSATSGRSATSFYLGAFPRALLGEYSRALMQDSITYFRPVINGALLHMTADRYSHPYFDLFLDWTGMQSKERRETFMIGWQMGIAPTMRRREGLFFLRHSGTMYHFAKTLEPPANQFIHDNLTTVTQVGMDLSKSRRFESFNELSLSFGYSLEAEDDRGIGKWYLHNAVMGELKVDWNRIALHSTCYAGKGQMRYYAAHGNSLYWSDPAFRADFYDRTDLLVQCISKNYISLRADIVMHIFNSGVYMEQALILSANLGNIPTRRPRRNMDRPFWLTFTQRD